MAWKERYSRSCCPPIFFDRKAWDGALACADVLLALVKEPCLQCLGLGLLVMLQGRYWIDQFRRVIGAQTDSAAPTGSMSLRLVGLGSIPRGFICLLTKIFGVLSGGKVSASSRGAFSFNSFPCSLCGLLPRLFARGLLRSEEHTSELQSLMRISYAVFCLQKKNKNKTKT